MEIAMFPSILACRKNMSWPNILHSHVFLAFFFVDLAFVGESFCVFQKCWLSVDSRSSLTNFIFRQLHLHILTIYFLELQYHPKDLDGMRWKRSGSRAVFTTLHCSDTIRLKYLCCTQVYENQMNDYNEYIEIEL